jgi:RND family efflux transporter MFP subunit
MEDLREDASTRIEERPQPTRKANGMKALTRSKLLIIGAVCAAVLAVFVVIIARPGKQVSKAAPATTVEVVRVKQQSVPISSEWVGTLDGMVNADIRAQVSGYLLRQDYKEGAPVSKGQLLFEIDPRPYQAALDTSRGRLAQAESQLAQAESQLAQAQARVAQAESQSSQVEAQVAVAEANQGKTQLDLSRNAALVKDGVVSREEYDNALQANRATSAQVSAARASLKTAAAQIQGAKADERTARSGIAAARAQVAAAQAEVRTAEFNLSLTRIVSPVDGIAGIAQAQVGNLVNPQGGVLTTVSTLDPIKAYFTLSEQEYLAFTKRNPTLGEQNAANRQLELELVLADGSVYPEKGRFYLADRQVDPKTGAIRMAGVFPNPSNALRPGQYGRVRAVTSTRDAALLVPQRAVSELQGSYQVAVVGDDKKVSIRTVGVGERVGQMWVITEGLQPGESVVAEGTQKVKQGAAVNPIPYEANTAAAGSAAQQQ